MRKRKQPEQTPEKQASQGAERVRNRRRKALRSFVFRSVLLALVLYVLLFHLVGITVMPTGDMYPRIDAGDLLLYYRLEKSAKSQDIIVLEKAVNSDYSSVREEDATAREGGDGKPIRLASLWAAAPDWLTDALRFLGFRDPNEPEKTLFVCRVVAKAGDTVEVTEQGHLLINGNSMIESNIFYPTTEYLGFINYPLTLSEGEVFVLADFRNGGADSRFFGPVKEEEILGTVITVVRRNNL